jgi:putative transcriptional regulator
MPLIRCKRLVVFLAAIVLPVLLLAAAPADSPAPARQSLAGQLLVASPAMGDPRFANSVVLMVRHDRNGALGIVINRPLGERPFATLLQVLGEPSAEARGEVRIFLGGPVQPHIVFVLHSPDYRRPETMVVDTRVAMTATREILRDLAAGRGPAKSLVAFGYAGWAPGQLEGELALNAWYTAPADERLIFEEDRDRLWDLAMERRVREL